MFSEIATEVTIRTIAAAIVTELESNSTNAEVCVVLKKLGRFALTQFEWDEPDWAKEYHEKFKVIRKNKYEKKN